MIERPPNIRHLAALVATVDHGTVTRAAASVALTQPALTQAIAQLERTLECQLFERQPGGMRPTEPALLLVPRARAAIELIGSPRVTSTQIAAFLKVARAGSYSAAAEAADLSAASLHRAVKDLSFALGETLVERRGRHLMLTRQGAIRARKLGLAMAELRSGMAEVARLLGKAGGRIVIGAMPLSRARWLPRAILAFSAGHPDIDVAVVEGSHGELLGPLRDGEIDFLLGALRSDEVHEDLAQEPVFEDRLRIIMRKGHPLTQTSVLDRALLAASEWVLPSREAPLRNYWQAMMEDDAGEGFDAPHIAIECGSVLTIRELLLETDLLTLLSPDQLRVEIEAGLLVVRDPPSRIDRTIGIITRRDWRPNAAQSAMLATLRAIGSKI